MNHFWLEKTPTFLFIKFVKGFSWGKFAVKGFPHFELAHSTCLAVRVYNTKLKLYHCQRAYLRDLYQN